MTSTGVAGPASATFSPRSSCIERTRPKTEPAKKTSPTLRVPAWTSTVATLPRPASRRASSTTPRASPTAGAVSSCMSATMRISSSRCSMPCFFSAEISADGRVAAPRLEQHVLVGELLLDAVDVGVGLVDLVDRDDDRDLRGPGVVDRLDRLRHDGVVGRHDQDDDVGGLGAARAHRREGLVARRVEEDDRLAVDLDAVGADVLRDAAGLAGRDVGLADRVEQRRLAVVDVAHDGHDRGARNARRRPGASPAAASLAERVSSSSSSKDTTAASTPISLAIWTAVAASSVWLTVARTPRCRSRRWMSRREHAELLGELLDRDALGEEHRARRAPAS